MLFILLIIVLILWLILRSPFKYPYYTEEIDVSGRRNPSMEYFIEDFINNGGFISIERHNKRIDTWKQKSEERVERSLLKGLRRNQYIKSLDDENTYIFKLYRMKTKYKQKNYQKTSYKVENVIDVRSFSYEWLEQKYKALKDIGFEATLKDYNSKEQRRLMTKQLRDEIAKRDNYTCQNCGRYMPDGFGIEIDHIFPIAKGGKTVPSNLQVLCSKCNRSKSDKI